MDRAAEIATDLANHTKSCETCTNREECDIAADMRMDLLILAM